MNYANKSRYVLLGLTASTTSAEVGLPMTQLRMCIGHIHFERSAKTKNMGQYLFLYL